MRLIGIAGKMQTGKDTLCTELKHYSGLPAERVAFADALKLEVAEVCNTTVDHINNNKEQFRPMLQWWGTDFRRKQDTDYWIKRTWNRINHLPPYVHLVVIPDVRFFNEAEAIKRVGGLVVKMLRETDGKHTLHISETDLDDYKNYDMVINNNGPIQKLSQSAIDLLHKLNLPIQRI